MAEKKKSEPEVEPEVEADAEPTESGTEFGLVVVRDGHGQDTSIVVHPGDRFVVTTPAASVHVERQ